MEHRKGARLIKNAAHSLFNTSVADLIPWVVSIWIARQLGVDNYGVFTLVLWISGIFTWAIGMGFTHAITKFVAEFHGKNDMNVLRAIVKLVLKIEITVSVLVTAILLFFTTPIADYFFSPKESLFFFLSFLGLAPGMVTVVLASSVEGIQKFEYFTWANIIITPLSLIAKVAVIASGMGIGGMLTVMLIFSFINVLYYIIVLSREGLLFRGRTPPLPPALSKRIHRYNFSVMAIILCDKIVWDKSENFFLGRQCNSAQVGFYNLGFNIVQRFTSILPTTFWKILFPAMSNYSGLGAHHKTQRLFYLTTRYLAFITIPLGVGGSILAYQIIHFLYGYNFVGAQRPLQILFLASIITTLCNPGAAILYGYERQSFIYKLGFIMAAVNIILDLLLIHTMGALGAAICFTATTVTGSVIGTIYTCRTMRLRYPFPSIFKVVFATVVMAIVVQIIIMHDGGLLGFILASAIGAGVYLASALALGTFEDEDFILLRTIERVLPGTPKRWVHLLVALVGQFKNREFTDAETIVEAEKTPEGPSPE